MTSPSPCPVLSYSHHHHLLLLPPKFSIIMSPSPPSSPSVAARPSTAPASPPSAGYHPSASATALVTVAAAASPIPAPNHNPNSSSTNANSAARRGLPPPCWTNEETVALVDSYRDKWYSLRRGNLRAAHWDEVATAVARRSLHLPSATTKTAVQCRHKIEKLRKRYRSERQRSLNHDPNAPPSSPWIFFHKMDQMENPNPNPPPLHVSNPNPNHNTRIHQNHYPRYQESDDDDDDEEIEPQFHRRPQTVANGEGLKFTIPKAVRTSRAVPVGNPNPDPTGFNNPSFSKGFVTPGLEEMRRRVEAKRRREEEEEDEDKDYGAIGEMVSALRLLGDGYMRMEQMKMDMVREMGRARMEMELKRTEMVLNTQRRIIDSFVREVVGEKKMKRSLDS